MKKLLISLIVAGIVFVIVYFTGIRMGNLQMPALVRPLIGAYLGILAFASAYIFQSA